MNVLKSSRKVLYIFVRF